jgi:hypothetical protein
MGQWQGGDRNCDHFYTDVIPSKGCEDEIKMMLVTYPAAEIAAVKSFFSRNGAVEAYINIYKKIEFNAWIGEK